MRNYTIVTVNEAYGADYYVYCGQKLIGVFPSESMVRSVIAREENV